MTKRILHVVGGMNRAGVETWLMHVLRHIDRHEYQMDFLVHTTQPCAYDEEIRSLGSRIIPCLTPSNPVQYAFNFGRILREYGPYDIVHSHVHHFSGYALWLAAMAGVPGRIAHSHSDTSRVEASFQRRAYLGLMKRCIRRYATQGLAASVEAGNALFEPGWRDNGRYRILYCGIDLAPFALAVDRAAARAELGIAGDALVVGHVGRFNEPKNHRFLVEIANEVIQREPGAVFVLVGDGPLRPEIEQRVTALGLKEHFVFAGLRDDVPRLMMGAFDVFLFPSLYEGLPVTLIEAQAAGLPCVISDVISAEAGIVPELMHALPLDDSPALWAAKMLVHIAHNSKTTPQEALQTVDDSPFDIRHSVSNLAAVYDNQHS